MMLMAATMAAKNFLFFFLLLFRRNLLTLHVKIADYEQKEQKIFNENAHKHDQSKSFL